VLEDVANFEVLEVTAEGVVVCSHAFILPHFLVADES